MTNGTFQDKVNVDGNLRDLESLSKLLLRGNTRESAD